MKIAADEKRRRLLGCAAGGEARLDSLGSFAGGEARAEGPSYAAGGEARLDRLRVFRGFCGWNPYYEKRRRREAPPTLRVRRSTRSAARLSRDVRWWRGEGRRPELRRWRRSAARPGALGGPHGVPSKAGISLLGLGPWVPGPQCRRLLGCAARREARLDSLGSSAGGEAPLNLGP